MTESRQSDRRDEGDFDIYGALGQVVRAGDRLAAAAQRAMVDRPQDDELAAAFERWREVRGE